MSISTEVGLGQNVIEHPKRSQAEWKKIADSPDFRSLVSAKGKFLIPTIIFAIVYYFALPILAGYAPGLMKTKIIGTINFGYLFALSQFFVAWFIAWLYSSVANNTFDPLAEKIKQQQGGRGR